MSPKPSMPVRTKQSPEIGVAFIIREKFGWTLESLKRIYAHCPAPFTLHIVDCGYPRAIRTRMETFLRGRPHVDWIDVDRFLYPNEALNLVTARASEPILFQIQNDVLVEPGFFGYLLETMQAMHGDIVAPLTLDAQPGRKPSPHRDEGGGTEGLFKRERDGRLAIFERRSPGTERGRARVHRFEVHALLLTTAALRALGPLPVLNSREHLDLAVRAWKAGLRAYHDPRAVATHIYPPIHPRDREFFRFRWNLTLARRSHDYVKTTWRIRRMPRAMNFVRRQQDFLREEKILADG